MVKLVPAVICLFIVIPCQARIITVADDETADFNNIQAAINDANDGDTILVADGMYTGEGNRDIDFGGRAITVRSENGPNNCIIDCEGTYSDNHRGFYFHRGEDTNSVLNGITIINGYISSDYIGGGAILCEYSGPTVTNCIITENSTDALGSAIYCVGSSPAITNNKITKNRSYVYDGIVIYSYNDENLNISGNMISDNYANGTSFQVRVYIYGSGAVEIKNNIFVNNGLELGGYLSNALVSNNTFKDFTDEYDEFAIQIGGTSNHKNTVTIRRNVFSNFITNVQLSHFGAISIGGTGDAVNTGIIENNAFENIGGQAIYLSGTGSARIYGHVRNNTFANSKGSAIYLGGTSEAKVNGYIINNRFMNCGSFEIGEYRLPAIRIGGTGYVNIFAECIGNLIIGTGMHGLVPAIEIHGIYNSKQYAIFKNNTIVNNEQGIIKGSNVNSLEIVNCILWDNTESFHGVDKQEIHYCDISEELYSGSNGNICLEPCFTDPCNSDYHLRSQVGRWDPNSQSWVQDDVTSPCIDAGNPGCPVGDEPSPNGNRINMGTYGGTAQASKSPPNWRSIADMTNDWVVDSNDLKVFVDYWLQTGECIPSDLNRSQFVDFNDFAIFGLQWSYPSALEPGMTFQIDDCNMDAAMSEEPNQPRFSVWVEGSYIHFKDLMYANCCPEELGLDKEINGNEISLYEIGFGGLCFCMCYFPITATLGPFEDGTYTVEVYDNYGNSLGIVEVTIGGSTEPGITYQIEDCNRDASDVFAAEPPDLTRFTVTVEGLYIHFKDMMTANCCPDKLELEMAVEDNLITIYETEYTSEGCRCMCSFPITATLGPFEPGIYTLEVYETTGGFIGSTTITIGPGR